MLESIDYAELLTSLGSAKFTTLRPAQTEILKNYSEHHPTTADLAIELPTGAGKSLIALLIGEAWRREGRTVAVLTGNKTLARQMEAEGVTLGVPVERFEGSRTSISVASRRRYRRAQAIGIMNYWVMFNQNPVVDAADLLIIDDAHLAESALDSLYSVEIDTYSHPILFRAMATLFADSLPDSSVFRDALLDVPSRAGTELMSFLDQGMLADRIQWNIDNSAEIQKDSDLRFRWNRIRDRIREANLYADTRSICIRPYIYPLRDNARYELPTQRLYMSATIGDPADLARRLGTSPITKIGRDGQDVASTTLGRRLIVLNQDEKGMITERLGSVIAAALKSQPKSLWLCNSKADAASYREAVVPWLERHGLTGHPTWLLTSMGDEIDKFKAAKTGHLFVGGRFDGMDFHQSECRLVVLTTLPRAINLQESFAADYLRDSDFMTQRVNQRIIQALGRCNRSDEDFGVYVLADSRFAAAFSQERRRRGLPAGILAEIDLAEDLVEVGAADLVAYVQSFLACDFSTFDRDLAEANAGLPQHTGAPIGQPDNSTDEIAGWLDLYERQNFAAAETSFRDRQQQLGGTGQKELGAFVQWCQAKAAYLEGRRGDGAAAQRALVLLEEAISRGGASSWFNRLRSSVNRYRHASAQVSPVVSSDEFSAVMVRSLDDLLERVGPRRLPKTLALLDTKLNSEKHNEFSLGLEELGNLLGYAASRPKYGAATDCRWRGIFGNEREVFTWEAKIEHGTESVVDAHAVGQAHNQFNRALAELGPKGFTIRGLIVTHLERIDPSASSSLGSIRVVRKSAIIRLWERIRTILDAYGTTWSADDLGSRVAAGHAAASKLPPTGWLDRAVTGDEPYVDEVALLAEWPE